MIGARRRRQAGAPPGILPAGRAIALAIAVALGACGGPGPDPAAPDDGRLLDLEDPETTGRAAPDRADAETAPAAPRRREGTIARADLDRVLDAGPGRFLARVEVKARSSEGRFTGWEVVRSPWAHVDLQPGDVVLRVNGRSLEHPLELKLLWEDLRRAPAIEAQVERGGERFALRFTITAPAP